MSACFISLAVARHALVTSGEGAGFRWTANMTKWKSAACSLIGFVEVLAIAGLVEGFTFRSAGGLRRGIFHQRVSTVPAGAAQPRRHPSLWCMDDDILPMCTGFRSLAGKRRGAPPLRIGVEPVSSTVAGNSTSSTKMEEAPVVAVTGSGTDSEVGSNSGRKRQNLLKTLWQFSRPHTMIGTAVAIPAMGAFAAPPGIFPGRQFLLAMIWAMVPSLLINVYITGLNQITDVEIDEVNKPNLPIPAGHLSRTGAKVTVTLCLIAGMALGIMPSSLGSPGLTLTVLLSVIIGTAYSMPPLRLKRFPQLAALCVLVVRGSIINGGFYAHAQAAAYGLATQRTAWEALSFPLRDTRCALALAYFTVFAVVIALMKDVPDVAGDRKFNIPSFSVVLGEERLFVFARRLLTTLLWSTAGALGFGAREALSAGLRGIAASRGFVALAALACGQKVRTRARDVDPKRPDHVTAFYMFLWKIFYVSYIFLPLAR